MAMPRSSVFGAIYKMASVQMKALGANECAEVGALRHGVLSCLVLRPTVELLAPEPLDRALFSIGPLRHAAMVVSLELIRQIGIRETVAMHGGGERKPRRDRSLFRRPAHAQPRDRNDLLRQIQEFAEFTGPVADDTDRAAAQPNRVRRAQKRRQHDRCVDRGVEKQIEMVVGERLSAQLRELRQAAAICEKYEKDRRLARPRHAWKHCRNTRAFAAVSYDENIALL